jgi:hypothetical protein
MKFLNKFWLVAVVSVGLFSCSTKEDKQNEEGNTAVPAVNVEIPDSMDNSLTWEFSNSPDFVWTTHSPVGNGSKVGDINISIEKVSNRAELHVLKSNGVNKVPTTLQRVPLRSTSAILKVVAGELLIDTYSGHTRPTGYDNFLHPCGQYYDLKISMSSPQMGGGLAIVGADDPRAGFKGNVSIFTIANGESIYVSNPTAANLKISYISGSKMEYVDTGYCDVGVPYWNEDFVKCELLFNIKK